MNPHVELRYAPRRTCGACCACRAGIESRAEFPQHQRAVRAGATACAQHAALVDEADFFCPIFKRFSTVGPVAPIPTAIRRTFARREEDYFRRLDYTGALKSPFVWDVALSRSWRSTGAQSGEAFALYLTECLRWLYHFLIVLNVPCHACSVTHSDRRASFCGIPCITAKLRDGVPFILTEHGVYLREQNLFLSRFPRLFFAKHFRLILIRPSSRTNYRSAYVIAPVCH